MYSGNKRVMSDTANVVDFLLDDRTRLSKEIKKLKKERDVTCDVVNVRLSELADAEEDYADLEQRMVEQFNRHTKELSEKDKQIKKQQVHIDELNRHLKNNTNVNQTRKFLPVWYVEQIARIYTKYFKILDEKNIPPMGHHAKHTTIELSREYANVLGISASSTELNDEVRNFAYFTADSLETVAPGVL